MPATPRFLPFCAGFLLLATQTSVADPLRDFEHHVRTLDPQLRALIRRGVDTSPSLRALVAALMHSDVLVYVERQRLANPALAGMLTFVTRAGGVRYLRIQIAWDLAPQRQIATLAHELQHAIEVARTPSVIDSPTLAQAYAHIGWERERRGRQRGFESDAAIKAGIRVYREYVSGE
jgi:hypothetical protein